MAKPKRGRKKAHQQAKSNSKTGTTILLKTQERLAPENDTPESEPRTKPEIQPGQQPATKPDTKPVITPKTVEPVQPDREPVVNKLDGNKLRSQVVADSLTRLYPLEAQKCLEESRKAVPIFLFRASRPDSGSGIEITSADGNVRMVPRAFLDRGSMWNYHTYQDLIEVQTRSKRPQMRHFATCSRKKVIDQARSAGIHDSIYQIPELPDMIGSHLRSGNYISSEFSSWGGSLRVAMGYLVRGDTQARISVVDTRKFANTGIYYVPNLHSAGLTNDVSYADEYMVHGVIHGGPESGYRSVLWADLVAKGIDMVAPEYGVDGLSQTPESLTILTVKLAKQVASLFGSDLIVPVTAALLTSNNLNDPVGDWIPARTILYDGTQICSAIINVRREKMSTNSRST